MEKIKEMRKEVLQLLKDNNVNYFEWKNISTYIEELYENKKEKSTL